MKKTRKNRILRLMWIVLLFTLISTCMMTGTLAKYVTEGSGYDTARVAAWGVEINAGLPVGGLFSDTYDADDATYTLTQESVISAGGNVVAPGTEGVMSGFAITGTPEVACRITVDVNTTTSVLSGWLDASGTAAYEPIEWTLVNGSTPIVSGGTFAQLVSALNAISFDVPPNVNLAGAGIDYAISWEWPFSTSATNDDNDTNLGNLATPPTVTLDFDIIVTQIN